MSILIAIVLGIVQGLTEFLPVSSSGHLILFERLFGVSGNNMLFNIVVHLGSLMAVVICYRKKIWSMIKNPLSSEVINLVLACIPTLLIYVMFRDFFETSFNGVYLAICFLITAGFLIISSIAIKRRGSKDVDCKTAIVMGVFQGFAILPGVSRSGSTLTAGLCMGSSRDKVADFSFIMSAPIILGSLIVEIARGSIESVQLMPLVFGFLASFGAGYLAIRFMLRLIKDKSLYPFVIYLILLGVGVLLV